MPRKKFIPMRCGVLPVFDTLFVICKTETTHAGVYGKVLHDVEKEWV